MKRRVVIAGIWFAGLVCALLVIELYVGRRIEGHVMLLGDERADAMWPIAAVYGGYFAVIAAAWAFRPFRPIRSPDLARFQFLAALLSCIALNVWILYLIGRSHLFASPMGGVMSDIRTAVQFAAWGAALVATANAYLFGTRGLASAAPVTDADQTAAPGRITVLFIANNPIDTTRLRLDREYRAIDRSLRASTDGRRIRALNPGLVTRSELGLQILEYGATVVHFSGHGDEHGRLIFENTSGASVPASIDALTELFRLVKSTVRCVVLNACFSRRQAQEICKHIDCVVGMSVEITDQAAIDFAAAFYAALGGGMTMKEAFEFGCQAIETRGVIERAGERTPDRDVSTGDASAASDAAGRAARIDKVPVLLCRDGIAPDTFALLDRRSGAPPQDVASARPGDGSGP